MSLEKCRACGSVSGFPLSDRWKAMTKEQLTTEAWSLQRAWGASVSDLYKRIDSLEHRIFEQRKTIEHLEKRAAQMRARLRVIP